MQDDFMYQYALPILNERAGTGNPFFSVLLSISNHPPYVIPPYFHPHSDVLEEQIVEPQIRNRPHKMTQRSKR